MNIQQCILTTDFTLVYQEFSIYGGFLPAKYLLPMDLFQVCSLIHRPQCNHSVINYLNKAIEKTNLRANFLYSCIVALPGIMDTQDGGCFGV